MRSLPLALLLFGALLAPPRAALAQDDDDDVGAPAADTSRDEEARSLFAAGRTAFEAGRFADALAYFQRSYELSGRSLLLFNIGSAHDRMRQDEQALAAFEAYLREVPNAHNAPEVAARVEVLRRALADREAAPPSTVPVTVDVPPSEPAAAPDAPRPGREFAPIGSSILAGLALIAGGAAIGTWVDASDRYAELERGCFAAGGCTDAEIDASGVEAQLTATNVLLASSLVLGAAAIVVLVLELPLGGGDDDEARATSVSIRVGPGTLAVGGTF